VVQFCGPFFDWGEGGLAHFPCGFVLVERIRNTIAVHGSTEGCSKVVAELKLLIESFLGELLC
jgi:hypothetical protein